jgi:hypothetical protein
VSATVSAQVPVSGVVEMSVPEPVAAGRVCSIDNPDCEACSA